MFGDVWKWAGCYRATAKNIGVDPMYIREGLAQSIIDALYWVEHDTYSHDETTIRFHHKLVWIHPFPNGNGRHSRLAADLLVESLGEQRFTWGETLASDPPAARAAYIAALRQADAGELAPLVEFARR
jgi:Fic-DOC domain mobile mystery protein B